MGINFIDKDTEGALLETKGLLRRVRTAAGAARFGVPINTVIRSQVGSVAGRRSAYHPSSVEGLDRAIANFSGSGAALSRLKKQRAAAASRAAKGRAPRRTMDDFDRATAQRTAPGASPVTAAEVLSRLDSYRGGSEGRERLKKTLAQAMKREGLTDSAETRRSLRKMPKSAAQRVTELERALPGTFDTVGTGENRYFQRDLPNGNTLNIAVSDDEGYEVWQGTPGGNNEDEKLFTSLQEAIADIRKTVSSTKRSTSGTPTHVSTRVNAPDSDTEAKPLKGLDKDLDEAVTRGQITIRRAREMQKRRNES